MSLFLGIHEMGSATTDDEVQNSWSSYKAACGKHGCKPLRAHYNAQQGRAFCVTDAPSADEVKAAHEEAQVPLKEVVEVKVME